jgi:MYXO-CTERM domain-containing protein
MLRALVLLACTLLAWAVDPPVLASPPTARATVGVYFAALLSASNSPTSFSASPLPAGLHCDPGSGLISGTPSAAGSIDATVVAINGAGGTSATLTITVDAAGTGSVSNADVFRVSAGSACSLQLVSALATPDFAATGLPFDLSMGGDGLIAGAPGTAGVAWAEVSADGGTTATVLSIDVRTPNAAAPQFTLPVQPLAAAGAPFACLLSATADGAVSFTSATLPAWLTLSSGLLSGTPADGDGSVNLKISAHYGSAIADTVLAIPLSHPGAGAAVPASPAFIDATVGSGVGWLATSPVVGAQFSTLEPLPDGLSLLGGVLLGTPTTPGNANVHLTASVDVLGVPTEVTTTLALRIADLTVGAPQFAAMVPPNLTVLTPCALAVGISTGTATTFALSGPAGWSIDSTGLVTATPATAGVVALRVTASNAAHQSSVTTILARIDAATAGATFAAALRSSPEATSWTVLGLPDDLLVSNLGLMTGTPTILALGDANLQLTANGSGSNGTSSVLRVAARATGAPLITDAGPWYLTQGQPARIALAASAASTWSVSGLPAGLTQSGSVLLGTPAAAGISDLTLTAAVGSKRSTTTAAIIVTSPVGGTPVFSDPGLLLGTIGTPFSATLVAAGTTLGYTAVPLPAGLAIDGTGTISGTPTTAGTTTVQVTAQNGSGTVQTLVVIRISASGGSSDPAVSGVSGGCGAGAAGLLLLGGLAFRRRRR